MIDLKIFRSFFQVSSTSCMSNQKRFNHPTAENLSATSPSPLLPGHPPLHQSPARLPQDPLPHWHALPHCQVTTSEPPTRLKVTAQVQAWHQALQKSLSVVPNQQNPDPHCYAGHYLQTGFTRDRPTPKSALLPSPLSAAPLARW